MTEQEAAQALQWARQKIANGYGEDEGSRQWYEVSRLALGLAEKLNQRTETVAGMYVLLGEEQAAREQAEARVKVLEAALKPFADIALLRDMEPNGVDRISAPDLFINPRQVREARAALSPPADGGRG